MDFTTWALLVSAFFIAACLWLLSLFPQQRRRTDFPDEYENWSAEK